MQLSKVVRNAWLPLLIVAVVVVGGFTVARVKSFFGAENAATATSARVDDSKPFKPKVVKYEIFGSAHRRQRELPGSQRRAAAVGRRAAALDVGPQHDRAFGVSRTSRRKATVITWVAVSPSITKSRTKKYPTACTP